MGLFLGWALIDQRSEFGGPAMAGSNTWEYFLLLVL